MIDLASTLNKHTLDFANFDLTQNTFGAGSGAKPSYDYSNMKPTFQYKTERNSPSYEGQYVNSSGDEGSTLAKIPRTRREYLEIHKRNMVINRRREKVKNQQLVK